MDIYRNAIASIESAGSGGYSAIGPTHPRLGRALGRYQVMESNIPQWSQAALGRTVTADEFLANPQIQDAIFDHQFGGYVEKFGPSGAAQAWFAGPGGVGKTNRKDSLGTSVGQYAEKFNRAIGSAPQDRPQPRPQGILSTNSPQTEAPMQDQRATGLFGALFPNMTADRQDRLAVALSGLSMNPNQGVVQMAEQRMADRREDRKEAKGQAKQAQQRNVTLQWLQTQAPNNPNAAQALDMLSQGVIDAQGALQLAMQRPERQDPTALMQNVEFIMQRNPGMPFEQALQAAKSGQVINVNGQAPSPATGYRNVFDDQGRLVAQEPIPGGPVDTEQRQSRQAQQQATQAQEQQQQTTDNVVVNQTRALRAMMDNGGLFDLPEAGIAGNLLGKLNLSQEAVDFGNRLTTLKGMVAFDQLAKMREASPTGGALGSITERELSTLAAQLGSLEQTSSPELIRETLSLLETVMRKADAYPNASQFGFGGGAPAAGTKIKVYNPQTGRLE